VRETPGVSVVIPTRDRPKLLRRAVRSVVDQDYTGPIECIVVVDGPEQPQLPEIAPGSDRNVQIIRNVRSPGPAGARNTGALAASNDLIAFLDDDDVWLPTKLTRQVAALRAHPGAFVVGCGVLIRTRSDDVARPAPRRVIRYPDLLRSRMMELNSSTILVRRASFLETIGLMDEELPGGSAEDYEWVLRAAQEHPIPMVSEPLARIHWDRVSFFADRLRDTADALRIILGRHAGFVTSPRGRARILGQIAFAEAATARPRAAVDAATSAIAWNPFEPRAYLALAVTTRLLPASWVSRTLTRLGRGV
jgi:glycosyltransferase involved in cell wall biosynthesis